MLRSLKDEYFEDNDNGNDDDNYNDNNDIDSDFLIENDLDDIDNKEYTNTINYNSGDSELDVYFKYGTNNHKLDGKHSLKRDTILNGKINEISSDSYNDNTISSQISMDNYSDDNISYDNINIFDDGISGTDDILSKKKLSEDVYELLRKNTDLDFTLNRRKPNKAIFNSYYKMLLDNINGQYTKSEIFVELSYYFTDNIFNMYKLLDKKYATIIIIELREKGYLKNLDNINFL